MAERLGLPLLSPNLLHTKKKKRHSMSAVLFYDPWQGARQAPPVADEARRASGSRSQRTSKCFCEVRCGNGNSGSRKQYLQALGSQNA